MDRQPREAGRADVRAAAATLARAFDDDPVMAWILPDAGQRVRRLELMFATVTRRLHLYHGATDVVEGPGTADGAGAGVLGAAVWTPPGRHVQPAWRVLAALPGLLRALGGRLPAASRALSAGERLHPREPHWYLAFIGTDPPRQGTGVGGALLRARLQRADAGGMPAYLESSKESNIGYYERFGFRVTGEIPVGGAGAPSIYPMWRDPA